MPPRVGLSKNPKKATAKKQAQKSAPSRRQKRRATPSNDEHSGDESSNSTDHESSVQQPKKKRSKLFQPESDGGKASDESAEEVTDAAGPENEDASEVMLKEPCKNVNIPLYRWSTTFRSTTVCQFPKNQQSKKTLQGTSYSSSLIRRLSNLSRVTTPLTR
jgi:hypothetical protein